MSYTFCICAQEVTYLQHLFLNQTMTKKMKKVDYYNVNIHYVKWLYMNTGA